MNLRRDANWDSGTSQNLCRLLDDHEIIFSTDLFWHSSAESHQHFFLSMDEIQSFRIKGKLPLHCHYCRAMICVACCLQFTEGTRKSRYKKGQWRRGGVFFMADANYPDLLHLFGRIPASHFLTFCHAWKIPGEIPVHSKASQVLRESIRLWFSLRQPSPPCYNASHSLAVLSQISSYFVLVSASSPQGCLGHTQRLDH